MVSDVTLDRLVIRKAVEALERDDNHFDEGNFSRARVISPELLAIEYFCEDECINQEEPFGYEEYSVFSNALFDAVMTAYARSLGVSMPKTHGIVLAQNNLLPRGPYREDISNGSVTPVSITDRIDSVSWGDVPEEEQRELREEWWDTVYSVQKESGLIIADSFFPDIENKKDKPGDEDFNNVLYDGEELYFIDPTRWRVKGGQSRFRELVRQHLPPVYRSDGERVYFDLEHEPVFPRRTMDVSESAEQHLQQFRFRF